DVHVGHAVARADLAEGVTGLDGVGNRAATVAGLRLVRVLGLLLGLVRPVLQVVTDGLVLVRLGPALGLGLLELLLRLCGVPRGLVDPLLCVLDVIAVESVLDHVESAHEELLLSSSSWRTAGSTLGRHLRHRRPAAAASVRRSQHRAASRRPDLQEGTGGKKGGKVTGSEPKRAVAEEDAAVA